MTIDNATGADALLANLVAVVTGGGGGIGAAVGAVAGGVTGLAASAATRGPQIVIPPEALLSFRLATPVTVTPVPDTVTPFVDDVPVKPDPVRVTVGLLFRPPRLGLIEVSVGPVTVKVGAPAVGLVPPNVVTVTVLEPSVALAVITKVAVTVVSLTGVMPVTET